MTITRRTLVSTGIVLAILGVIIVVSVTLYLSSPRRDVEVALGLRFLPFSIRNIRTSVDVWTDYVVRGYFEIDPRDFERTLTARDYSTNHYSPYPLRDELVLPGKSIEATTLYSWNDPSSSCVLQTDDTHEWIYFEYGTD